MRTAIDPASSSAIARRSTVDDRGSSIAETFDGARETMLPPAPLGPAPKPISGPVRRLVLSDSLCPRSSRVSARATLSLDSAYGRESGDRSPEDAFGDEDGRRSHFEKSDLFVCGVDLEHQIGAGGMGAVWLGFHATRGTRVAVKFLRPSLAKHPVAVARFQREAAAASRLDSPHVVRVFEHGLTPSGIPYIVMEWLEGTSLQDRWDELGQLDFAETLEILRQAALALAQAHEVGVVHRDIKPDNLFLTKRDGQWVVKVLDFGIAKLLDPNVRPSVEADDVDRVTAAGAVIGTPQFMSPEQMRGAADVGPASDVWALGVVAYACLAGRLPFEHVPVLPAIAVEPLAPVPVSSLAPNIPPAFQAWLDKALAFHLEERFENGRAMLDALEVVRRDWRATAKRMTSAPPPAEADNAYVVRSRSFAARRARFSARAAAIAALSASVMMGAMMGATWAWSHLPLALRSAPGASSATVAIEMSALVNSMHAAAPSTSAPSPAIAPPSAPTLEPAAQKTAVSRPTSPESREASGRTAKHPAAKRAPAVR